MIRFISTNDICLAFRFEKVFPGGDINNQPSLSFDIATASQMLGFNENGEYIPADQYIYIDHNGNQVEEFDDATILAAGSIFPSLYPEIEGDVNYMISFYSDAFMWKKEFMAFSSILNSDFLTTIYKELL